MMKHIPKGMYYNCQNAVRRNATNVLLDMLERFGIKSARNVRRT